MFAEVIVDIKAKEVDRPFSYKIPESMTESVVPGVRVSVPFGKGSTLRTGFVLRITDSVSFDESKCKSIENVVEGARRIEDNLISLAIWMRHRFGGTLYQALSVVLPEKKQVEARKEAFVLKAASDEQIEEALFEAERKKYYAQARLLSALRDTDRIPMSIAKDRLRIAPQTITALTQKGLISTFSSDNPNIDRSLLEEAEKKRNSHVEKALNDEQRAAAREILKSDLKTHLLYGVTGSGKTEVFLDLIEKTLREGKQAIVLIPEISLTYQTVMRFYERFGEKVSVVHSKVSKGEKCERFEKAKRGEISVMIGPRSALFTPFQNLGIIIVDEFHDGSYDSDQVPKYSAVEVAEKRGELENAKVVLGSATPLISYYERALNGEIGLEKLTKRAVQGSVLPTVTAVDLREELKAKNKSVFSRVLQEKIKDRLEKGEQTMLFLNRRGYSGAVSCRSCGEGISCPHCSVSLNYHKNGHLKCHICGYERPMVTECPTCGSKLIGAFGIGTERVEQMCHELFPEARTLRMDADTTEGKNAHEEIIDAFSHGEADILIGTQMIVKGHDFPNVTLVGILAADLSLLVPDYRSSERTFELLTQAEGRAGRRGIQGECVVQTYTPEHYAIQAAISQDFEAFYENEKLYRQQMTYPPYGYFMGIRVFGPNQDAGFLAISKLKDRLAQRFSGVRFLGPCEDSPYKVKDQYRFVCFFKTKTLSELLSVKQGAETLFEEELKTKTLFMTIEN